MFGTISIDIPLENRNRLNPTKKLCTAVSAESPDLFRIRGVPCIDRGPDKSRPPVPYEHWNDTGNRAEGVGDPVFKKTANFARPSSVSADTPNFFKVPGVAINSSSAITGVEAICSPPPGHIPFNLPETYMHGKEVKPTADPVTLPGRWRETDREVGEWGHATQDFHEALIRMRQEGAGRRTLEERTKRQSHGCNDRDSAAPAPAPAAPQQRPRDAAGLSTPLPHLSRPKLSTLSKQNKSQTDSNQNPDSVTKPSSRGDDRSPVTEKGIQGRRDRRASAVEVFMSRLEGERGPGNRRESIAAFRKILVGCPTNNSVRFADDANSTATKGNSAGSEEMLSVEGAKSAELRKVFARREEADAVVSELMSTKNGSYMLNRERDASKTLLGRRPATRTSPVGVVRVSAIKV